MPDDLISQMGIIKNLVSAYNIPIFEKQGYEADDILATIARQASDSNIEVCIVTGDKDILQIVDDRIKVYNTHKDDLIYDEKAVRERFSGLGPENIIDIIALAGDATDNIPGVRGIGEKTAIELISEFGSLEDLLKNIDKVKSEARKKALRENEKMAILSRELAVVDTGVPIDVDFMELELKPPDRARLLEMFKELEFKAFIKEFTPKESLESTYEMIDDDKKLARLVGEIKGLKEFAFDFETTSEDPMLAKLVGVSFSWKVGRAYYVPVNKYFDCDTVLGALRPVFEDPSILLLTQKAGNCLHNHP